MATPQQYPNFVAGVAAAGITELTSIAATFADWQLEPKATIAVDTRDPVVLATRLLAALKYPEHVFDGLSAAAQDRVAAAVGVVARGRWVSPPVPSGTPDYRAPSWEKDVYAVLFARAAAPAAEAREVAPRPSHARVWPELRSVGSWRRVADGAELSVELAAGLGKGWKAGPATGDLALPSVRSARLGLQLVGIPGGSFTMGLSPAERTELARVVKGRGPEAGEHLKALAAAARPVRKVTVTPFLLAVAPLSEMSAAALEASGDSGNPHRVVRVESPVAAAAVERSGLRLTSEAEWEWVARSPGAMPWADTEPEAWVEAHLATPVGKHPHPFGVQALGWGEWVDDGWHPTYKGAPAGTAAWDPKTRPETVRGGALDLWPWQVGGEVLLGHAASRDRSGDGAMHAVRLASDLPPRG